MRPPPICWPIIVGRSLPAKPEHTVVIRRTVVEQRITPIDPDRPDFAGVAEGFDLTRTLTDHEVRTISSGMDRFAVLVFHDQKITDEQQLAFSRKFGELEQATGDIAQGAQRRLGMELNDISNLDREGKIVERDDRRRLFGLGNMLWHSDSSFKATPAMYSLLSARVIPESGGNTEFADMRAAYDALDDATRAEIEDLICEHSQLYSRGILGFTDFTDEERVRFAPVRQRLVRVHPVTGRKSLFLSSHAGAIIGWPVPEARAFLRDLTEHATDRRFVYAHVWRPHDLVIWDNRATMHRARRFDAKVVRDMRRTTLVGTPTVAGQQAAA
jgi:alpha-ketoglutarate-dependent 2,4-dichlorophenoxyacetate dioxygenase